MTRLLIHPLVLIFGSWLSMACASFGQQVNTSLPSLVADQITLNNKSQLVAEGDVYVIYRKRVLRATKILYDSDTDALEIMGPIRLVDGDDIVLVASSAELGADLQNGLLRSARMVFSEQLQMAALQVKRVTGRYTQLDNATASSCQVCTSDSVPLWQIRAQRLVHDKQTKQFYFTGAQFRVGGIPLFYLPRLRMPDPTLKRARGFLMPGGSSNTLVGYGVKLPYFIPLSDHKDLTLTPYLSAKTNTLEFRYRELMANGNLNMTGALTGDSLERGRNRGYIFGNGKFNFDHKYKLAFDLEAASDASYLSDYTISTKDRLDSSISVSRAQKTKFFSAEAVVFDSLRPTEDNSSLPRFMFDVQKDQRWFPAKLGGETRLSVEAHSHIRASNVDITGRDVSRINSELSWRRRWTLPLGIRAGLLGQLDFDAFSIAQDSEYESNVKANTSHAALDLRWPLKKVTGKSTYDFFEPLIQISASRGTTPDLRVDESTLAEFDEGNLLSLSRFPAPDQRERGHRAAFGMRYLQSNTSGWRTALTMGQILRSKAKDSATFSSSSGLNGRASDILIAGQLQNTSGLILTARGLMGMDGGIEKAEANATWRRDWGRVWANYISLPDDPDEDRTSQLSEWSLNAGYNLSSGWYTDASIRYDIIASRAATAGFKLTYENECVRSILSWSRQFASSTNLKPSSDFVFAVDLRGFGFSGKDGRQKRTCRS